MQWRLSWLHAARVTQFSPRIALETRAFSSTSRRSSRSAIPLVTLGQLQKQNAPDGDIKVAGLVRSARWKKKIVFVDVDDGSTSKPLQAILPLELASQTITNGAYIELTGKWRSSQAKGQSHELQVSAAENVGESVALDHPIQKANMTQEYLRTVPHMRMRTGHQALLARARSQVISSVSQYFNSRPRPAIQVHPPLITSSDCEGAGEVFTVSKPDEAEDDMFFREPKYLSVSSQLHLEAYSAALGDVWTLSPTFRAETSDTRRHLAEFYMLEAEYRSTNRLEDITYEVESLIKAITSDLPSSPVGRQILEYSSDQKSRNEDESLSVDDRWKRVDSSWAQITYADAMVELEKASDANPSLFKHKPDWEHGLALEHELWTVENLGHGNPIFVTHYPRHIKPFYMLPSEASDTTNIHHQTDDSRDLRSTVACFDLLFPHNVAEVAGGSLREHRLDQLIRSMREKGLIKEATSTEESNYPHLQHGESLGSLQWYADLRRFGSSPHGGFGLGFDRLLGYLTGFTNVRDVAGFPRYRGTCPC
jgi:asparaginyl-tRNA synthetase